MTPELWQKVKVIFQMALEKNPEERSAFVDEAAEGDPMLAGEVRSLLDHATVGSFLESPPIELLAQALGVPVEGSRIGPYRIVREIEAGGMGEVYEAEQETPLQRRVALKLIKRGLDTARVIARFGLERQTLALMNHANIAQVFDAGTTEDGRPYFVMELVEGEPVTQYCDRRSVGVRDRLELFKQVCLGAQHAHQKGIIHCDLKPANVLVMIQDGRAIPKIIDFGIAKAVDPSGQAKLEAKIGTPGYMSPEQKAQEPLDTRTDVYSLGVLLYELLVGELPPDSASTGEATTRVEWFTSPAGESVRQLPANTPAPGRPLRGDLEWIVAKALKRDRIDRYASASELAIDIDRHLRHEPVLASPPGTAYRFGKFLRRHKMGVAAGTTILLALVLGATGAGIGLVRARKAESVERQQARKAGQEAEAARRVSDFLVGLFEVSEPDSAKGNVITAREILDTGSRKIASELQGQPETRAILLDTMGVVYQSLGLFDRAEPLLKESLALRRRQFGAVHAEVAKSLNDLAELRRAQGRYPEAEVLHRQALTIRQQVLKPGHPDIANSFNNLGLVYYNQGRYADAEPWFQKALLLWKKARDPRVPTALSHLALLYRDEGKYDQAIPLFEKALAIQEKELGPEHSDVGGNLNNLADIYRSIGRYTKAESLLKRVLTITEKSMGSGHPIVNTVQSNLAMVYRVEGKLSEAEALYKLVLAADEKARGPEHPDYATSLNNLAVVYREQGKYDEAEPMLMRALAIRKKALGPEHPHVASSLNQLGLLHTTLHKYVEAESDFKRALAIREKSLGPDHPHVAVSLTNLANLYRLQGRYDQAEPLLTRALAIWEKIPQPSQPDLIATLDAEAALMRETGRTNEAASLALRAQGIRDRLDRENRIP